MLQKISQLGKRVNRQQMKGLLGGALSTGKCIMPGQPCGGGGCTEPDPVCCYNYVCTGSNGIIYNPGFCVAPGGGEEK